MTEIRLREAREPDAACLAAIDALANPEPWSESSFLGSIRGDQVRVAEDGNGRIAGFVVLQLAADESEILGLAVRQDAQRRGIGRLLLNAALEQARARGARSCHLEVRESNAAARALYAALGFESAGRRKAYYGAGTEREDALLLRLVLD